MNINCSACKYFEQLKQVGGCIDEGQCIRFPPTIHPINKPYIPGNSFSVYPLVEGGNIACGEFKAKVIK